MSQTIISRKIWLVGAVGRMQTVKDQVILAQAFVRALILAPDLKARLRLVMVGDSPVGMDQEAL